MDVSSLISQIPISSAKSAVNAAQGLAIEKGKQLVAGQEQLLLDEISALERKVNDITKEYAQKFGATRGCHICRYYFCVTS